MASLTPRLTKLIEQALAECKPLTLTVNETAELAARVGIEDPRDLHEPTVPIAKRGGHQPTAHGPPPTEPPPKPGGSG